jgi:hypothetical protein
MLPSAPSLKCSICGWASIFVLFLALFLPLMLGMVLRMSFVYACAVFGVFLIFANWRCCRRSGNKRLAVVFSLVLGAIIFEGLWTNSVNAHGQNRVREQAQFAMDREEIRKKLMIPLDSTMTMLSYEKIVGMDDMIFLTLEMKSEDVDSFIKNSPFRDVKLLSDRRYVDNADTRKCASYESAEIGLPDAKYLRILINHDFGQKVIVYLQWFET